MGNSGINGNHEVVERVSAIFEQRMNLDVPSADTDLFGEGILDSVGFVDLLLHLEQEFEVKSAPEDLEPDNFRSISRISEYVAHARRSAVAV